MLEQLERHKYLVLGIAVLLFVAALASAALNDSGSQPITFASSDGLADGTPIRVHVTGQIARPGVYDLLEGERVVDAIDAAGGATADGDPETLNLARRLRDGEQIVVPGRSRSEKAPQATVPGAPVNLNTATESQLDTLPGIGEAYSRRIIDSRTVDGPFTTLDELVTRKVLPASALERIRDLVSLEP